MRTGKHVWVLTRNNTADHSFPGYLIGAYNSLESAQRDSGVESGGWKKFRDDQWRFQDNHGLWTIKQMPIKRRN